MCQCLDGSRREDRAPCSTDGTSGGSLDPCRARRRPRRRLASRRRLKEYRKSPQSRGLVAPGAATLGGPCTRRHRVRHGPHGQPTSPSTPPARASEREGEPKSTHRRTLPRSSGLVLLAVLSLAAVLLSVPHAAATTPGDNGRIAYKGCLDSARSTGAIFTSRSDGTHRRARQRRLPRRPAVRRTPRRQRAASGQPPRAADPPALRLVLPGRTARGLQPGRPRRGAGHLHAAALRRRRPPRHPDAAVGERAGLGVSLRSPWAGFRHGR